LGELLACSWRRDVDATECRVVFASPISLEQRDNSTWQDDKDEVLHVQEMIERKKCFFILSLFPSREKEGRKIRSIVTAIPNLA